MEFPNTRWLSFLLKYLLADAKVQDLVNVAGWRPTQVSETNQAQFDNRESSISVVYSYLMR